MATKQPIRKKTSQTSFNVQQFKNVFNIFFWLGLIASILALIYSWGMLGTAGADGGAALGLAFSLAPMLLAAPYLIVLGGLSAFVLMGLKGDQKSLFAILGFAMTVGGILSFFVFL